MMCLNIPIFLVSLTIYSVLACPFNLNFYGNMIGIGSYISHHSRIHAVMKSDAVAVSSEHPQTCQTRISSLWLLDIYIDPDLSSD